MFTLFLPSMRAKFSILLQWLQRIVDDRPHDENLDSLTIDDIRNGIYADVNLHIHITLTHEKPLSSKSVHPFLQSDHHLASHQTPNPILKTTDVPERCQRDIEPNVSYPTGSRYTLQWFVTPLQEALNRLPNNNDATFINEQLPKPADVPLHYNYGAVVVKHWGKNTSVLTDRSGVPRPSVLPMRDGRTAAQKRAAASKIKKSDVASADLEVEDTWDEDDVIMFLWSNTKEARERRAQKEQEDTAYLEDWRAGVTGIPDIVEST